MKINNIAISKIGSIKRFFDLRTYSLEKYKYTLQESVRFLAFLLPGVIFLSLAFCLLFAPQYLSLFFCAFLLAFGVAAVYIGYKVNQLRIKFSQISAQIEAKLIIDPESLYNINSRKSAAKKSAMKNSAADIFDEQLSSVLTSDLHSIQSVKTIKSQDKSKGDVVIELADGKKVICH